MSYLGLYRDPVVAEVTGRSEWRISDLVDGAIPATLYLVIPPSDISRTKPLIRLILNQIGRRLTEELTPKGARHRVLILLDELDRKSVVSGKRVSVRVDLGGRRILQKK